MQRRRYNFIWLFLALIFMGQSLLPVATLAEISVRCVSAPAASVPCAHMVVSLNDRKTIASRLSRLACCRNMIACRLMASGCEAKVSAAPRQAFALSAPKCLITISSTTAPNAVMMPNGHKWMLHSSPALAPPAIYAAVVLHPAIISSDPHVPFSLSPRLLTASHGLRAPPCA